MTPDQTIELAKQAGLLPNHEVYEEDLQRFAELVGNAKLEEAAIRAWSCGMDWHMRRDTSDVREVGSAIAEQIRSIKK